MIIGIAISSTTRELTDKQRAEPLKRFFKDTPLRRITAEMVADYQADRKAQTRTMGTGEEKQDIPIGNASVNIEVGLLRRVLKRNRLWTRLADTVEMFSEESEVGRALERDEQMRLVEIAATKANWMTTYCAAVLALNTTMRSVEIKNLSRGRLKENARPLLPHSPGSQTEGRRGHERSRHRSR